jgi:hypothetical protein
LGYKKNLIKVYGFVDCVDIILDVNIGENEMKTWKKILIGLALVATVFASGVVTYLFTSFLSYDRQPLYYGETPEKIVIQGVNYNSTQNSISVYVNAINNEGSKAVFLHATVKDQIGNVIATIPISDTINEFKLTRITVKLDNPLQSGTYNVTLTTTEGSNFVSPSFTVP